MPADGVSTCQMLSTSILFFFDCTTFDVSRINHQLAFTAELYHISVRHRIRKFARAPNLFSHRHFSRWTLAQFDIISNEFSDTLFVLISNR